MRGQANMDRRRNVFARETFLSPCYAILSAKAITPSNYRTKRAFVEDYVRFRMTTATEDERRQYRSRIEGADKAFRKALVTEAERMWSSGR